jgi:hypothetical protein
MEAVYTAFPDGFVRQRVFGGPLASGSLVAERTRPITGGVPETAGTGGMMVLVEDRETYDFSTFDRVQYQCLLVVHPTLGDNRVSRKRKETSGVFSAWSAWATEPKGGGGGGFVAGSVFFEGTNVSGGSISQNAFNTYPINNVVTNLGGGAFNTSTYIYTIPETGLYDCQATIRINDGASVRSLGVGIGIANADAPHFFWQDTLPSRYARQYRRLTRFTLGDQVRLYIYSDSNDYTVNAGNLVIMKVAN